jgi:alkylation response protein AidB-like acyl-CoA dehydrogenase
LEITYSAELDALRIELRAYFKTLLTELPTGGLAEMRGDRGREIMRRIGADGWLGIGWPAEFGGQGRSAAEQFVFFDEAKRAGAPLPMLALNTVGPTIMRYGTDAQKQRFLPPILAGEVDYAVGYTEPDAGTDLASLQTRAVRHGDTYVINGRKVFTTGGGTADYIWLAARTNPDVSKHKGLSIFIVPAGTKGFSWTPFPTVAEGGTRTNSSRATVATWYDDVTTPAENRIGPEDAGCELITRQMNQERVTLAAAGGWAQELADDIRRWAAGQRAVSGMGLLLDYPLPRYLTATKHLALAAGSSQWRLDRLGRVLARETKAAANLEPLGGAQ